MSKPLSETHPTLCLFCKEVVAGRKDKKYCSQKCARKYHYANNREASLATSKKWRENNKEYDKARLKTYKSREEYRLKNREYGRRQIEKKGYRKIQRSPEENFKAACRQYAKRHVPKTVCSMCVNTEKLQLHHSKGYVARSIEGVICLCEPCHLQVVHGRGTKIGM